MLAEAKPPPVCEASAQYALNSGSCPAKSTSASRRKWRPPTENTWHGQYRAAGEVSFGKSPSQNATSLLQNASTTGVRARNVSSTEKRPVPQLHPPRRLGHDAFFCQRPDRRLRTWRPERLVTTQCADQFQALAASTWLFLCRRYSSTARSRSISSHSTSGSRSETRLASWANFAISRRAAEFDVASRSRNNFVAQQIARGARWDGHSGHLSRKWDGPAELEPGAGSCFHWHTPPQFVDEAFEEERLVGCVAKRAGNSENDPARVSLDRPAPPANVGAAELVSPCSSELGLNLFIVFLNPRRSFFT